MILMYKIAVMGERDSVYGFAAVGLEVHAVQPGENIVRRVKALAESGCAVIYMTEQLFSAAGADLDIFNAQPLLAIIPIPGAGGGTGLGMARVKKSVEKAVGSDIIFGNDLGG